jgi:putative hydrolase of the HAD superfamily
MLPKAILFDLDDTLITTTQASARTWAALAQEFAPILGVEPEALSDAIARGRKALYSDPELHKAWRHRMEEAPAEILRREIDTAILARAPADTPAHFSKRYVETFFQSLELFPDSLGVLTACRKQGVQLGMITNGGAVWQRRKIRQFALAPWFACVLVEGEFGQGKPAPEIYQHALAQLQAAPEHTWMIGDRLDWDVLAPMKLGITGVWFDHLHKGLPDNSAQTPNHVVRDLAGLLPLLTA